MRLRILEAAENLYRNKTLSEVSMEDISERADISRVTLYNYFTNQDCIILNIGIKNLQKIRERQKEKKINLLTGFTQVHNLFQDLLNGFLENPLNHKIWHYFLKLNADAETPTDIILEKIERGTIVEDEIKYLMALYLKEMRMLEEVWIESIKLGIQDNTIRDDYDSEQLVHYLFTLLSGLVNTFGVEKFQLEKVNLGENIFSQMTLELVSRFLRM